MKWRIPVIWQMTGIQEVDAERLEDAMACACNDFDPADSEFKDGSLELDCEDVDVVRSLYNGNRPDGLERVYPELQYYGTEDRERDISWDGDGNDYDDIREVRSSRGMLQYRIIFDLAGCRYYCNVEALTLCEALGVFFCENPHITYDMIVDHVEV